MASAKIARSHLEDVLSDETLRSGGSVVAVFTAGQEQERRRASEILKSHGGLDTVYWGGWVTEHM